MARSAAVPSSASLFSLYTLLRAGVALALAGAASVGGRAQVTDPTVFINEFHYDNTGTDAGEFVEVAGPAGTDLTGYSIVLYNGSTFQTYLPLVNLSGTIPNQQNGFGTVHVTYAVNGIQNGSPDGLALVRNATEVIQFLSYEGTITATNGPAAGLTSTDIGVSEVGTEPIGQSLGLSGAGDSYGDFTWTGPAGESPGAVNVGQTFGGPPPTPSLSINSATLVEGNSGLANMTFTVSLTSPAGAGGVTFDIDTADDSASEATDYDAVHLDTASIAQGGLTYSFNVPIRGDTAVEPDESFFAHVSNVVGANTAATSGVGTIANDDSATPPSTAIVINELDSDQVSTDAGEFIELFDGGAGNTPLNGLSVVFYNGGNDLSYASFDLTGRATDASGYFVLGNAAVPGVDLIFNGNVLQNGADAVALYSGGPFPVNAPVTLTNLLDAVVYDTSDLDDPGLLVLLNAGQPQVNEDGGPGGGIVDSIQRCPNGGGGQRNTAGFVALAPTPGAANGPCPVPPPPAEPHTIAEIQGTTDVSPFAGADVITTGVVTGRKSNGFFLQSQTPDGNAETSEGVFVFTTTAPMVDDGGALRRVALGDVLEVTGRVIEFRRNDDARPETLTEITNSPTLVLLSEGASQPAALNASDLYIPNAGSRMDQLEPYESMLVTAGPLRTVAPTNGFGEFFAVLGNPPRPFREPGITIGDVLPPDAPDPNDIPRFDGNFERIMVETDEQTDDLGVRRAALGVSTGATVTGVFGPLDYAFDEYRIQVDFSAVVEATGGASAAVPAPAPSGSQFTIGSANLQNFINPSPDRVAKAALMVTQVLRTPAVLAAIEVGGVGDLQLLGDAVNLAAGTSYQAYLLATDPPNTQNIGFLVDTARVSVTEDPIQLFKGKQFEYGGVTDTLHDRPPLVMKVNLHRAGSSQTFPVTLLLLHLKSLIEVDSLAPFGPGLPFTLGGRNREKRRLGAEDVANEIEARQHENLVVLGDFNAFEFSDGYGDITGTLKGTPVPANQVVEASADTWDHELINLVDTVADPDQRYSFVFQGSAQVLDHVLINTQMLSHLAFLHYARNNADFPASLGTDFTRSERVADHDPVLAYFTFPPAATNTTIASSLNPSFLGQPVTFTATVTSSVGPLTGSVEFRDGANLLGTEPLDSTGEAAFTTSALTLGTHAISATFVGSPEFLSSGASLTQTVAVDTRPVITAFTPDHGPVGAPVLITGQRFNGVTAVTFNGTSTLFVRLSSSLILTIVPTGATSGPIAVTADGGTGTSATPFTVTTPAPQVLFFTPDSGRVGQLVLIAGAHFSGATSVTFGSTPAVFTVIGPNLISATVPAGAVTAPITVTTPGGSGTSDRSFRVRP